MELLGSTQTATYTRPKTSHFLPAISTMASSYRGAQLPLTPHHVSSQWRRSSGNNYFRAGSASIPSFQGGGGGMDATLDLARSKSMYMYPSNRTLLGTRYTPDDWHKSNQSNYRESESSRNSAERLRKDTLRLMQDRDQLTRRTQEYTSKNIGERLNDIVFWRSELNHEIDNMVTEIAALAEVKRRLERALAETESPLQVGVVVSTRGVDGCVCWCERST